MGHPKAVYSFKSRLVWTQANMYLVKSWVSSLWDILKDSWRSMMMEHWSAHLWGVRISYDWTCRGQFIVDSNATGKCYAIGSITIYMCMFLFRWAEFSNTKSGVKVHTQMQRPVFFNTKVHDINAVDDISYEPLACYVFDPGYWDFARLFHINQINFFFIIREKWKTKYEIVSGIDILEDDYNVLRDLISKSSVRRFQWMMLVVTACIICNLKYSLYAIN